MNHSAIRNALTAVAAAAALLGFEANTAKADCTSATITQVLREDTQCAGRMAFKTTADSHWICTKNDDQGKIVLAAFLAGKNIGFQFQSGSNLCVMSPDNNYQDTTRYIFIF